MRGLPTQYPRPKARRSTTPSATSPAMSGVLTRPVADGTTVPGMGAIGAGYPITSAPARASVAPETRFARPLTGRSFSVQHGLCLVHPQVGEAIGVRVALASHVLEGDAADFVREQPGFR